jgi:hypothetical protein
VRYEMWTLIGFQYVTQRSRKNDHFPYIYIVYHENSLCIIIVWRRWLFFLIGIKTSFNTLGFVVVDVVAVSPLFLTIKMLICSFTHTCELMTIVGFLVSPFSFACHRKIERRIPQSSWFLQRYKKERKTLWNSVWLSGTTITRRLSPFPSLPLSLSLSLSVYFIPLLYSYIIIYKRWRR